MISRLVVRDIRFPTSRGRDGSDAMNAAPDYSAAYVVLQARRLEGHGFAFTLGRGNEVCVAAIEALRPFVEGRRLRDIISDMRAFSRSLTQESQLRWLGPEKGVIHMAAAAVINAVWDLRAKIERKPLWKLLADMAPEELVACVDFRYIDDALTPREALAILRRLRPTRGVGEEKVLREGLPAYLTSAGWLGYPEAKVRRLCREALAQGWTRFKIKVGGADDRRRLAAVREEIGPDRILLTDANQAWGVGEAARKMKALAAFTPYWIEEPTSPDDVLGHAAIRRAIRPIKVATGEHCQNRVLFKQLLQAKAVDVCQIDACRLGGVNEVLAVLLLCAKFGVPVCPHAGGVGLCELVQHLAIFDALCVSGTQEGRWVEYVDHLHEHFVDPVAVSGGRYLAPRRPGFSSQMRPESLSAYEFPRGKAWRKK